MNLLLSISYRLMPLLCLSLWLVGCDQLQTTPTPTAERIVSETVPADLSPSPTAAQSATATPTPIPTTSPPQETAPSTTLTPAPIPTSDLVDGWLLYENKFYGYQFSYPPEAEISAEGVTSIPSGELPAGMSFDDYIAQLRERYPGDICVGLRYKAGFITIAAPPDKGLQYSGPCGVSGVGAYDTIRKTEEVSIDGRSYNTFGWEIRERDETSAWHNEFHSLRLDDGLYITYGSWADSSYDEYVAVKDTLLQIVTSLRSQATAVKLEDTLILYATLQDQDWALKAYPYQRAFSEDTFDVFYGPDANMEDLRRYTRFNYGPQLSPNGRYLLLPGIGGYGGPGNTGLWFVNLQTNDTRQLLPRATPFTWSPYGDRITYVDGDTLYTLSVTEGAEPQALFTHPDLRSLYARWSPDGSSITAMTSAQGERDENGSPQLTDTYWLVDANSGQAAELTSRSSAAMEHAAEEMAWSPNGRYLLVRSELFTREGEPLPVQFPGGAHWLPLPFPPDDQELLLVNGNDGLVIMNIEGEEVVRISDGYVDTWDFSHNGRFLAYLDPQSENDLLIFDLQNHETIRLDPVAIQVGALYWSGDDDYLLLGESGRSGSIWALPVKPNSHPHLLLESGVLIDALPAPAKEVAPATAVAIPFINPADLPTVETATADGPVILFARAEDLWRAGATGAHVEPLTTDSALRWGMTQPDSDAYLAAITRPPHVSPNGRWLTFAPDSSSLSLVDLAALEAEPRQIKPASPLPAWSPDSRYLAYGTADSLYVYDIESNELKTLLHADQLSQVAWSPDMSHLAFACCFEPTKPYQGINFGEIRNVELASGYVDIVNAATSTVGGGTFPICWTATGIATTSPLKAASCSYSGSSVDDLSPDGAQHAYLSLRSSDDDEYFRLLIVKDTATDEILWQREVPRVQKVFWSPDGTYLLLGSDGYLSKAVIYRLPADGTAAPEQILSNAYLLDVIPQWGIE